MSSSVIMKNIERTLFLRADEEHRIQRYIVDAVAAIIVTLVVTACIFFAHLYPTIPNISFLYLLVVLGFASTRGLYAAIIVSIVAFLSFDYFLVPPIFTLTIGKAEEWLALFIFLVTAIITGQLASALRKRAEEAMRGEAETRALYDLVNATTSEAGLERQLHVVARTVLENFKSAGVMDCAILLPDAHGVLALQADAQQREASLSLSSDERSTAQSVLEQGRIFDLYVDPALSQPGAVNPDAHYRFRRVITQRQTGKRYMRFVPLRHGQKVMGVARLIMAEGSRPFPQEPLESNGRDTLNHQSAFFWTFLDQAIAMVERAQLQREALQIELLKRTDALRSALLSSVSHDLRTPLSSIKAAASSLLQEDVDWDEETRRSFAVTIEREADRLNRLVGNLLDMSRIEGGALTAEKEWYPIGELIHDVLGRMQGLLQNRVVNVDIPDDVPPVELDYLQIDQVITNLVENVVRYTPPESPIDIRVEVLDKMIEVTIADRGPGIPPYDLERVFDKFYRVSGAKRRGSSVMGTGLGLAVCRGLIEANGGRIWAKNREGGGAVFHFTLPLAEEQEDHL